MYSIEQVRQMCRGGVPHGDTSYLGSGENSTDGQHSAVVQFWTVALALKGRDKLQESDRAFARAEIARHTALLSVNALPDFSVRGRLLAARDGVGMSLESLAEWVGSAQGGSAMSKITDKIAFWQRALECKDALTPDMKAFAERELARQREALARLQPHPVLPPHGLAV